MLKKTFDSRGVVLLRKFGEMLVLHFINEEKENLSHPHRRGAYDHTF